MRLTEDARRSVVFLGHLADPTDSASFRAEATGFFVRYGVLTYLVTAAHVAVGFADDPFQMRLNKLDGGAGIIHFDPTVDGMDKWFLHPDPSVDVAVLCFPYRFREGGWDHLSVAESLLLSDADLARHDVGPGDTCYAVGLFRLLQGQQRSLPIVHRGSIAAMPSDELIPLRNWRGAGNAQTRAYLVEATNLRGLSGSPVLIRPTINIIADRLVVEGKGPEAGFSRGNVAGLSAPSCDVSLLGIWSGSWDAQTDEVLSVDQGREVRVPLGLGVVVPTSRLLELLETEPVKAQRQMLLDAIQKAAVPDATPE
ncbi:trypsin-like peptidase domain-containing protein [Brevundimonas lenta]|uniref:Serine protease n=1 Tax=Brevundimonas lenta TaxID=424796 RepID=A0A7W6JFC1_9CAUL|nr:trypsin-like peptidase domain-containing protein [Brevundimonas lenta]MBB4084084.1 hypothetical protein [Brevundimonas lenta]